MTGERVDGRGQRLAWGAGSFVVMCVALGVARFFHDNDLLEGLDKFFSVIGGTSGLLALVLTIQALRSAGSPAHTPGRHADSAVLDGLAAAVEQVWRPELRRRRLANPHPLPVAWTTVGPPIADHWSNIRSDGDPTPLNLDDCLDLRHPDALHQVLTDKRLRGRVVILGEPGAGKTSLLLREALRLLQARIPEDPVPVLLRLPTWNPDEQTLEQWITSQLATEYGCRSPITTGQLLPLLDGLDEMPAPRRARAVQAISNTFDLDQPLVLTSRTTEYLDTLTGLSGTTMAAAAVLELTAIPADVVRAYLQLATSRPGDWEEAFDRDTTQHGGRLATALNAPLWIDLACITHTDPDQPDNQPSRLLDLPDTETVHTYLLDRLIPAVYPDPPEPDPTGHTWHRADADRYLRKLANHMHRRNTQDLAWWELAHTLPRHIRLASGLMGGLAFGLTIGLAFGLTLGLTGGLVLTSWGAFQYARLSWCTRNDLPWSIMAFLADAHRRGVLRQAGGVYQFRHGLLRDRLT
ncbi:NACHT domain-containing protein [Plantactinospora sp. ZYX-F-223]|uniref:NACHT domain-containing protein n=1 Tax=Plantactinospora sp. ZYX-F-223 TaxID=3144103 RepID=UPI0031FCDB84